MENNINNLNLASPWSRIAATFIDSAIQLFIYLLIALPLVLGSTLSTSAILENQLNSTSNITDPSSLLALSTGLNAVTTAILWIINLSLWVVIFLIIPLYIWKAQTIGKKLLKIKIAKEDGQEASKGDIFKRYSIPLGVMVANIIPVLGSCLGCIYFIVTVVNTIMLFADEKKQTLFDKLAKTIIVNE